MIKASILPGQGVRSESQMQAGHGLEGLAVGMARACP